MLNQHHPDDERLSALASRDDDAIADATLTSHLDACTRCTDLVSELGALRMSLADLPDLQPHRPLQFLPPVADAPAAEGPTAWIRRLFAPALTAGAALAMVGLVGTALPALESMASGAAMQDAASEAAEGGDEGAPAAAGASDALLGGADRDGETAVGSQSEEVSRFETYDNQLPAERSPWPMVLFTGVALMIAIALLRWIVVPRAG